MKAFTDWIGRALTTSEAKCVIVMVLWGGAARFFPDVIPLTLPPLDLTAAGMGVMTLSPATLGVYVLGRCAIKAFSDGQFPFQPEMTKTVTTVQPIDVATRTVIDTPAKEEKP